MSNEMGLDEIAILSIQDGQLYAYIGINSLGKHWPSEIVHNGVTYTLEATWNLPAQMKSYIQAARYTDTRRML